MEGERGAERKLFLNMNGSINKFVYRIHKLQKKPAYIVRSCVLAVGVSLGLLERHKAHCEISAKCEMPGGALM